MKVYIVSEAMPYEGEAITGVFSVQTWLDWQNR